MRKKMSAGVFACMTVAMGMAAGAMAAETGVVEDFSGGDANGWFAQTPSTNPGTGGVGGDGDGFLQMSRTPDLPGPLGIHARDKKLHSAFLGDYPAVGATSMTFWLKNLGAIDLEIHLGLADGQFGQGARYSAIKGVILPVGTDWTEFTVDLLADDFVYIGFEDPPSATFDEVLQGVNAVFFRHDTPPILLGPPTMTAGVFGLDRVVLNGAQGCTGPSGDFDGDGDVDLLDAAAILDCMTGPGPAGEDCTCAFDFDGDVDIDFADFGQFQISFTGK